MCDVCNDTLFENLNQLNEHKLEVHKIKQIED